MKIETILQEEIKSEFKELKSMELGTDKYKSTVDGLTKLVDRAIKIEELNNDAQDKIYKENELDLKQQQLLEERKDRKVRNSITVASIVIPTIVTIWGTLKTLKFEEVGTVTTNAGRNFMNRLFKK